MQIFFCYAQTISKRFPNWENGYVICGYIRILQHDKKLFLLKYYLVEIEKKDQRSFMI